MRSNRILAWTMLFVIMLILAVPSSLYAKEFSDVPITASYYKAVDKLSNMGVIQAGATASSARMTRPPAQSSAHFSPGRTDMTARLRLSGRSRFRM